MTSKPRKMSSTQPIPQYTWQGFITYAESFGQAAAYVSNGIHLMHNAPVGALACHCIELSLKVVLLGVNLLMPHYAPAPAGFFFARLTGGLPRGREELGPTMTAGPFRASYFASVRDD